MRPSASLQNGCPEQTIRFRLVEPVGREKAFPNSPTNQRIRKEVQLENIYTQPPLTRAQATALCCEFSAKLGAEVELDWESDSGYLGVDRKGLSNQAFLSFLKHNYCFSFRKIRRIKMGNTFAK